ncbi:MAG: GNAT family N-acetyltransferase [Pseudomonadota bacterium]
MSDAPLIREATAGDYEGVVALYAEVDALHAQRAPWMFRAPLSEPRSREFFDNQLRAADSTLLVADAGGIVGLAAVILRSAPEMSIFVPQRWGVLDNIAVARAWRRRGVGRALTIAAEAWGLTRGAQWLELVVYDFNTDARAFYEALGYGPATLKLRKPLR